MSKFGRWMRTHRYRVAGILITSFLIMDVAAYLAISNMSTGERSAELVEYPGEIKAIDRSMQGYFYIMTDGAVYKTMWFRYMRYGVPGTPTSIEVGTESDFLAVVTDERFLSVFFPEVENPDFTRDYGERIKVVAFSQRGGQHGYSPKDVYLLKQNESGHHLLAVSSLVENGNILYYHHFTTNVTMHARPEFIHYLAFAQDDDSICLFDEAQRSMTLLPMPGHVVEISFSAKATYLGIIFDGEEGRVLRIYDPFYKRVQMDIPVPDDACQLAFEDEGVRMYLRSGDEVLRFQGDGFVPYFHEDGLVSFFMPSVADYVYTITSEEIVQHSPNEFVPKWRCHLENASNATFMVDASGSAILGFVGNQLILIDNSIAVEGSKTSWVLFGVMVALQATIIAIVIAWGKATKLRTLGLIALWTGALAGVLIAGLFPDVPMVDWFGAELVYLLISGATAALISLFVWDQQIGAYSIAIGAFVGMFLGILLALAAGFVLAMTGYAFPGTEQFFTTSAYGLATGFKMGLVGGAVGMLVGLTYQGRVGSGN